MEKEHKDKERERKDRFIWSKGEVTFIPPEKNKQKAEQKQIKKKNKQE